MPDTCGVAVLLSVPLMTNVTTMSEYRVKPRLARQRLIRAVVAGVVILAVGYATLPIWLPTGWIARRLADQLSADLHRHVKINRLRIGWLDGVVLEDLTIDARPDGPTEVLAHVGRVRCDFTPMTTLWTDRVGQLEITDPELWIVIDEMGRLNIEDLRAKRGGRLPTLSYVLRGLRCHVRTPEVSQAFEIDAMECELVPRTGLLRLAAVMMIPRSGKSREPEADAPIDSGRLSVDAHIQVAQLKPGEPLSGDVEVEWTNLALTDLPVPLISRLPVEQVGGTTSGQLAFQPQPDLGVDFDLDIVLNGVKITREGFDRSAQVPDADLRCDGHWDPATDRIRLGRLEYQTPALHVRQSGEVERPALVLDPNGDVPFELHFQGRIKDWVSLGHEVPELDHFLRSVGADCTGGANFTLHMIHERDKCHLILDVEGRDSQWVLADDVMTYLAADAGVPKSFHINSRHNPKTRELTQLVVTSHIGELSLSARGRTMLPELSPTTDPDGATVLEAWILEPWIAVLPTFESDVTLEARDAGAIPALLPFVSEVLNLQGRGGPVHLHARIEPDENASRVDVTLAVQEGATLEVGDFVRKPAGEPLSLDATVQIPHTDSGRIDELRLDVKHGPSHLALRTTNFGLRYSVAALASNDWENPPMGVEAAGEVQVRVDRVEDLLPLWSGWRDLNRGPERRELVGSFELTARGSVSSRPDDWLTHGKLNLVADDLAMRWDDALNKPADEPLSVTLSHWAQWLPAEREQSLNVNVARPSGELSGSWTFTSATLNTNTGDPKAYHSNGPFEQLSIVADIHDIRDWLSLTPDLADRVSSVQPDGSISFAVDTWRLGDSRDVSLFMDATEASITPSDESSIDKPVGVPAVATLRLQQDATTSRWKLEHGRFCLAGANVEEISGTIGAHLPVIREKAGTLFVETPVIRSASLHAQGDLTLNESLSRLHPRMAEWIRLFDLAGNTSWDLSVEVDSHDISIKGNLDTDQMNFALSLDNPVAPCAHKPIGIPAALTFDLSLTKCLENTSCRVDVNDLRLVLEDNSVQASGSLEIDIDSVIGRHAGKPIRSLDLDPVQLKWPRADQLLKRLPDARIDTLSGGLEARLTITGSDGAFDFGPSRLRFDDVTLGAAAEPIQLAGSLTFDAQQLNIEQLQWSWGKSNGTVSAVVRERDDSYSVQAGLAFGHLDVNDLDEQIADLKTITEVIPVSASSSSSPAALETAPASAPSDARADSLATLRRILEHLRRSDINIHTHADLVSLTLPLQIDAVLDAGVLRATLENGKAKMEFSCLVDGGYVTGSLRTNLNVAQPSYHLQYIADRIQPGSLVNRYLARTFPGMKASGALTLIDETYRELRPDADDPNFDVGKGQIIINGGTIEGRAAPLWMTRIFPGLNLARFNFSYMHSWFEKLPSGTIRHQMIFQGRFYNIYMIGYTDPDQHMHYEVGIDFLADFDSKYWVDSGQGRIPLFVKTGTILADGTLADETVLPTKHARIIDTLLVRNNPLVTAYHAVRKRVLARQ